MQSDEGAICSSIASLDYVDLSDYCRLCLQIPEESQLLDLQLIYDEEEQLTYYDCFVVCTQIDLHAGGIYAPHQLCKSCGLELQVAYDFHKKVQESKKFLNQFQKTHITDEETLNTTLTKDETSHVTDLVIEEVVHKTSDETQLPVPIQLENESTENEVVTTEEENIEHLDAHIEYEELEEHIEMEEYPTVEELIDDDAGTVQIRINDEEYLIQKVNDSNNETLVKPRHESQVLPKTSYNKSRNKRKGSLRNNAENISKFQYSSAESDVESINDEINMTESTAGEQCQKDTTSVTATKTDQNDVVISKKGDIQPRRRFSAQLEYVYTEEYESEHQEVISTSNTFLDTTNCFTRGATNIDMTEASIPLYSSEITSVDPLNTALPTADTSVPPIKIISTQRTCHYNCDHCQKSFPSRSKMLWHRRMHEPDRPHFNCPHESCDRIYLSRQSCELHYKQTHCSPDDYQPLECTLCHKTFAIPQTLEIHMRYHTRDFPYECAHCERSFAQKGHLTTHLQVMHNNLRYICPVERCGKVFKNTISLRNHSFSHTGMPFRCAYCDRGYPQKSKLKVHLKLKHEVVMSIEELESMRKFKSFRTRHSFVKMEATQSVDANSETAEASLDSSSMNEYFVDVVEEEVC
ncbi:PREDICTED: zinc finger protein 510 isoform X1 [Bactrocera latifrons]|uniref:zinc finger protein 510 isoform X1 n=1 Tax=Bactrocera latifrons TaxID=174628 RepID=UPI0008DE84BE|nr:PREDICTED: zinc finger protein 510 isoform X1 [Bactrocera latifrons]